MLKATKVSDSARSQKYLIESVKGNTIEKEAYVYLESDGTWTIRYLARTQFKYNLKSYQAALDHLTGLGW
jgi:hypothetical protein